MKVDRLILGGGLAGTTLAVHLFKQGVEFLLLESSPRLGGKVETHWTPEACLEMGPNSFSNQSDEIFRLLELLEMDADLLKANEAAKNRYILNKGKTVRLPGKPTEIFTTEALSPRAKLRFLSELFYVPAKEREEESVQEFFTRHFGKEVADRFADPFVSGIFAGDPAKISLAAAFPTMAEAERRSRSLIRYLITQRRTAKATPQSFQLKKGLESIFHRAREKLGPERIRISEQVREVVPEGRQFRVITDRENYTTSQVYLTVPSYGAAPLVPRRTELSSLLQQIDYAPVVTCHLRVSREESFSFNGFGILLPSLEQRGILGVLWNSSSFPDLYPDKGHHYLTVYLGGDRHREILEKTDEGIRRIAGREVQDLFHLKGEPTFIQMKRHPQAIPQYRLHHGKIIRGIERALTDLPGLKLAGNYLAGISMPSTVAQAASLVTQRSQSVNR